jgi:hypothetical protein
MEELAVPEHEAHGHLTPEETERFVLQTVATHAESLLRTAERHSLCADDAHDAYQRGLEIFVRRAATLDSARVGRWLHVVTRRQRGTEHAFAPMSRIGRSRSHAEGGADHLRRFAGAVAPPEPRRGGWVAGTHR